MRTPPDLIARAFDRSSRPGPMIRDGNRLDYARLAPLHYRAGPPATMTRVLRALEPATGELAGVLVVSRPTLNGAWRRMAWPGAYDAGPKDCRARRLNAGLRTISRVIVDPRFRGRGVAVALVRRYLERPETLHTEAVAAMGLVCPFFERAGMQRIAGGEHPSARDARLLRAAARHGLPDAESAAAHLLASPTATPLERPLRAWARASTSTRPLACGPAGPIALAAAGTLLAPPVAYAHTAV